MPKLEMKYTAVSGREFTVVVELENLDNQRYTINYQFPTDVPSVEDFAELPTFLHSSVQQVDDCAMALISWAAKTYGEDEAQNAMVEAVDRLLPTDGTTASPYAGLGEDDGEH